MKRLLSMMLAAAMLLSLAACGGSEGGSSSSDQSGGKGSSSTDASKSSANSSAPDKSEVPEELPPEEPKVPLLVVGETVTVDDVCEFYLDYTNITVDVMPPSPGSWYSHYEADAGKVYTDICIAYKNLQTSAIGADEVMTGTLIYSGQYEFSGFSMIEEDSRGDFTYSNITNIAPLNTEYLHYLFSIPEEAGSDDQSIEVNLEIAGKEYRVMVKEGGTGSVTADPPADGAGKQSGAVAQGETVTTKNAEFFVDYADITADVMPPSPGSWYSHYEADAGKVYVDLCIGYKNTSERNVGADDVISAKMKYAGKYDYTGFSMIEEDNRSDFTYSNITNIAPLSTEYVHYLFSVPEEVATSGESVVITFRIDGNEYTYQVR